MCVCTLQIFSGIDVLHDLYYYDDNESAPAFIVTYVVSLAVAIGVGLSGLCFTGKCARHKKSGHAVGDIAEC